MSDRTEASWIPAFDELGESLQRAAETEPNRRASRHGRRVAVGVIAAVVIVPGGLALALTGGESEPLAVPAPPPLESQIGNTVTCPDGTARTVTRDDFNRALAQLDGRSSALPGAPAPAPAPGTGDTAAPGSTTRPAGYRFSCSSTGEIEAVPVAVP